MRTFCLLILSLVVALGAVAQPAQGDYRLSTAEVRKAVLAVIGEQLSDFRAGEPGKAYALAAARFRTQFPEARFTEVVRRSYPEIWSNTEARYGVVRDDGVSAMVVVQVTSKDGKVAAYDYFLLKERETWRIGGVIRHEPGKPQA